GFRAGSQPAGMPARKQDCLPHVDATDMTYLLLFGVFLLAFANGANDNFKGVATLWGAGRSYGTAAKTVARTMAKRVTLIEPMTGLTANLAGALLVTAASRWSLPVSTTHVTMGGIFGVGVRRREQTNWKMVRQIVLAWVVTMPLGLLCGLACYRVLVIGSN